MNKYIGLLGQRQKRNKQTNKQKKSITPARERLPCVLFSQVHIQAMK